MPLDAEEDGDTLLSYIGDLGSGMFIGNDVANDTLFFASFTTLSSVSIFNLGKSA